MINIYTGYSVFLGISLLFTSGSITATVTTVKSLDDANSSGSASSKSANSKASIMSSALNVIGDNDDNTQLAHSVLVVQRPKNRPKPISSVSNDFYWYNTVLNDDSSSSSVNIESLPLKTSTSTTTTTTTSTTTTTESPPSVLSLSSTLNLTGETLHSNHRPLGKINKTRPWLRPISTTKRKKPPITLIGNSNLPDLSMMPRTTGLPFSFFDDEVPILMSNNHRKFPYSLTTRNKLTSEYANYWTTPSTTTFYNDYSVFNKLPSKLQPNRRRSTTTTTTTTPSPQMIMGSKPPLKVSHVIASKNKEPDEVKSSVLTVLDPQGGLAHLPPNTSIVHRNVLVPYRPGRPKPTSAATTQYPIYPILAGITNWPIQSNHSNINNVNEINNWQWDETDIYSGTTVPPPSFSVPSDSVTTSKSPIEYLDPIPVSTINRPTIAIIGSRPGGFGSFRPTPTAIITSSPSSSSSSSTVGSNSIPTPAQSFLISDVQTQQQHINSHSTPSTTTQHVISVTPIGSNSGHVIPSSVNTSNGQHHQQQHLFGEVIHSSRPPSATAASHQSDVNLSSAAAAAASTSSSLTTSGSQSFIVTTTTTTESSKPTKDTYVHAIYAPPMPSTLPKPATIPASTSSLLALFGVDSFSGLFTQLTVFKALLFTALVILLPPLTVAAAFSSLAG